ncbi:CWC25 [Malassezia furfur]|nr:CWC25 [Malassezia furfur]
MGAGDLNMKKSWHPMLHSNQEKVWLQEQEAIKERKRLEELRKEREHERQMQELQRIHEEAGGKKRVERVEWMYATPAAKGEPSEAELEDYLLGKKRVDKLLQGNEMQQLSRTADVGKADAGDAMSQRDMATKIREDPLLAIKQQEQAVYEMLMKDPTRLRQMRAKMGLEPDRSERRHRHRDGDRSTRHSHHGRHSRSERSRYDDDRSERSSRHDDRSERSSRYDDRSSRDAYRSERHRSHRYDRYDRRDVRRDPDDRRHEEDRYASSRHGRDDYERRHSSSRYDDAERSYVSGRRDRDGRDRRLEDGPSKYEDRASRSSRAESSQASEYTHRNRYRAQDRPRGGRERSRSPARMDDTTREAKLAAMMSDARKLEDQRNAWIDKVNAEEQSRQAEEDQARNDAHDHSKWREGGGTGKAAFLLDQQRSLWGEQSGGMDLHERLRRSRNGLQRVGAED